MKLLVPITFVVIKNDNETTTTLHTLCDLGAAESLVSKKFTKEFKVTKEKKQNWSTILGTFQTERKTKAKFKLPKLNSLAEIDYNFM